MLDSRCAKRFLRLLTGLVFHPAECQATLLPRHSWRGYRFKLRWPTMKQVPVALSATWNEYIYTYTHTHIYTCIYTCIQCVHERCVCVYVCNEGAQNQYLYIRPLLIPRPKWLKKYPSDLKNKIEQSGWLMLSETQYSILYLSNSHSLKHVSLKKIWNTVFIVFIDLFFVFLSSGRVL